MKSNYQNKSDYDLAKIICKKNRESEKAFQEIYRRYSRMIHTYFNKILTDSEITEDIFQETFIKFYNKFSIEESKVNVPGFLMRIARNLCLNANRNYKASVEIEEIDLQFSYNPNYEQKEMLDLVSKAVELLPNEFKESFVMREYSGMEYHEIAEQLNISIGNVKTRVYRAKPKLKIILKPYLKDYYGSIK